MREWFKARNTWGIAIQSLPDDAAGRLVKALWDYTMYGVVRELEGPEQYILPMFIATLEQDTARDSEISAKRAMAGSMGGRQRVANEANAIFATQVIANEANASNKNKNKNKNENTEQEEDKKRIRRFSPPSLEEVTEYCQSRGNHVDPENFINFYESKGWKVGNSPMKDWKACVRTWEKRDSGKKVSAQQYEQRDYADVQARIMASQRERIRKRLNADNFEQRDYSGVNDEMMRDLEKQMDRFKATGEVDS